MAATSNWTKEQAAQALASRAEELGRGPRVTDCVASTETCPSATVIKRLFGSWNEGLEAAGLEAMIARNVDPSRNTWTKDEIIDALNRWTAEHGSAPVSRDWTREGARRRVGRRRGPQLEDELDRWPLSSLVIRSFGSWSAAIAVAGLTEQRPAPQRTRPRWSNEDILSSFVRWHRQNGRPPTRHEWERLPRSDYPSYRTVLLRFGSWAAALEAAEMPRETETGNLIRQIQERPGISLHELTENTSLSEHSVRTLLSRKVKAGVITKESRGSSARFWPR